MSTRTYSPERIASGRYPLLGVSVNALSIPMLGRIIREAIEADEQIIVASVNLHSIYLHRKDRDMRQFFGVADFHRIDGMPVVWWGKLLGYPLERDNRVTWLDWIHPLMAEAARNGWRVFYLGSKLGVAGRAAMVLRERYSGLLIETAPGYFDATPGSGENEEIVGKINSYRPDILMVGMGMPRQERWILQNRQRLDVRVILPCGACLDYVAGEIPSPPRWVGRIGLEWLARLMAEPRRLWRRYLLEPLSLFDLMALDAARVLRERLARTRK